MNASLTIITAQGGAGVAPGSPSAKGPGMAPTITPVRGLPAEPLRGYPKVLALQHQQLLRPLRSQRPAPFNRFVIVTSLLEGARFIAAAQG